MTAAQQIADRINALTERQAAEVYTGMRLALADARQKGENLPSLADAMVMAGNALEKRIGQARFDELMEQIDARAWA